MDLFPKAILNAFYLVFSSLYSHVTFHKAKQDLICPTFIFFRFLKMMISYVIYRRIQKYDMRGTFMH